MIKKNLSTLIITSIIILLPVLAGIILWDRLPEVIATHFGANGEPNGWSSRAFVVFGLPCILLAFQWICMLGTNADPKRERISPKMMKLVLWIIPVIACVTMTLVYSEALGYPLKMGTVMPVLIGVLLIIIGNYLPKCRQSYTMGIKLPWTLADEDNWNRTHRMAGKLWVICGVAFLLAAFLRIDWLIIAIFVVMIAVPTLYSYVLHVRKRREN
ncbi:MAG: SdpI family protein [Clostridia bacterium]|nr:SdpI family protein [Clostridia bacterium]